MLDQLEALNISDPSFIAFDTQWSNYVKANLNFDRSVNATRVINSARIPSESDINPDMSQ